MELNELFGFVKEEHHRLITHYGLKDDPKTKYAMFTKLIEELGELSEALLEVDSLQRGDKLRKAKKDLSHEFADVLLVTMILAEELKVDIGEALVRKIGKIKKRNYK